MLKVNDINVYYGAIHAIKGVSFEVHEGEVVTLIGAALLLLVGGLYLIFSKVIASSAKLPTMRLPSE